MRLSYHALFGKYLVRRHHRVVLGVLVSYILTYRSIESLMY